MIEKTNYIANTLDDFMQEVLYELLRAQDFVTATRSDELGNFSEIVGATLVLTNPRARLSRSESKGKLFSALGEFFWYMSGTNGLGFIDYYIPNVYKKEADNGIVHSGYGDRLFSRFGINQLANIIEKLKTSPTSRQAVIQIFSALDLQYRSVPCTCTLQFLLRNERLHLLVNMRSNDAYLGLPHDVFAFTMIQEIIARSLNVDVGIYKHFVGSLHLYQKHRPSAENYLNEGWQNEISMDPMPIGDPWPAIEIVQGIERQLRENSKVDFTDIDIHEYWRDICLILAIWRRIKEKDYPGCDQLKNKLTSKFYNTFIDTRISA
jgi:thymidylate synthase